MFNPDMKEELEKEIKNIKSFTKAMMPVDTEKDYPQAVKPKEKEISEED